MTVYARSDVSAVAISETHGGCGQTHSRPVVEGAPAPLWALTCHGGCEDVLRRDAHWSGTIAEIPETPDEKLTRENWDKRGATDQNNVVALALARLAGVELPESMQRMVSGVAPHLPAAPAEAPPGVECGNGHQVPVAAKFCPECGAGMRPDEAPPPGSTPEPAVRDGSADGSGDGSGDGAGQEDQDGAQQQSPDIQPDPQVDATTAAEHTCKTCGKPVHRKGGKGRWPTLCDGCKAAS